MKQAPSDLVQHGRVEIFLIFLRSAIPCGTTTFITGTAASQATRTAPGPPRSVA